MYLSERPKPLTKFLVHMPSMINPQSEKNNPLLSTPLHWGWAVFLASITLATLAFRYALPIRDGDIWWHMLYGQYFLENHTLIADHTIFSWTQTTNDTIYCTWLPDILFYLIYQWIGLPGLFLFRYVCLATIIVGGGLYARKIGVLRRPLVWLIIIVALLMSYTAAFVKPEMISFAFMTLIVWNWYHIRSGGDAVRRNCYLFPVIMLVWVNSHGAYVFGVIFLILIAVGEILNTWFSHGQTLSPQLRRHLSIALLLSAITPFINPYGYNYTVKLFFDLLPTADNLAYNRKIAAGLSTFDFETPFQNFRLYADIAIVVLLLQYVRNFRLNTIEWSSLLTNLVFAFLYTRFFRTTFYFAPVFAFSAIYLLRSLSPLTIRRLPILSNFKAPIISIVAVCLVSFSLYSGYKSPEFYQWMGFGISESNPVAEAEYVKKYFPKARIGNSYDQGAYLLWKLWPDNRVFFDSRHFPYRAWSDDLFINFQQGINFQNFLQKYPCDLWVVSLRMSKPLVLFAQSPDWQMAFYGKNSMIFVRRDLPLPQDSPRVAADILDLKNPLNAYTIFAIVCNIEDWPTTDRLLLAMAEKFGSKLVDDWALGFRDGMRYYFNRQYDKALSKFSSVQSGYVNTEVVEANCHQLLAARAWQQKETMEAQAHVRHAWNLAPGNIYSAFNAGLIDWYQSELLSPDIANKKEGKESWRYYLQYFLENAPRHPDFMEYIAIAQALLNGEFQGDIDQLSLLTPTEPVKRRD